MKKIILICSVAAILVGCDVDQALLEKQNSNQPGVADLYTVNPQLAAGVEAGKSVGNAIPIPYVGLITSTIGSLILAFARHRAAVKNGAMTDSVINGIAAVFNSTKAQLSEAQIEQIKSLLRSAAVKAGVATELDKKVHSI